MAESTLLKEPLTQEMIDLGVGLLRVLDAMNIPVSSAFWLFDEEVNGWKLKLAAANTEITYHQIADARRALGLSREQFPLDLVSITDTRNEIVRALHAEFSEGPYTTPKRLGRGAIRGRFIDDAYVYKA